MKNMRTRPNESAIERETCKKLRELG